MRFLILLIALISTGLSWSQDLPFVVNGRVENLDLGKKEGGVTVAVVQNGSTISSTNTASNGKYSLKATVDFSQPYEVTFTKGGLVSKRVRFDFSKMNDEDTPASSEFRPVESLDMTLFKTRDNIDFSFLDTEPVAKFDWNENKLIPRLDQVASNKMRTRINDLLNKAEKDKAEAEAKYQAAIREADRLYEEKSYESAVTKYEEALGYKPMEQYPADKIVELEALIQAQKQQQLAQDQEDQEYNNLIAAADNFRDAGELEKAISKYQEALTKKDEQYPKDQISTLQAQIDAAKREKENQEKYDAAIASADNFMKQNSLRAARDKYEEATRLKPSEQYPKDKLKEIADKMGELEEKEALKKKYDEAVAAGDELYGQEDYQAAKEKYQEALTYESAATYPKERIKMCDEALNAAKAEEEKLARIQELLDSGNQKFTEEQYEEAKNDFNEVLTLDDQNAEATAKLTEIENKLKELADQEAQQQRFDDLVKQGDDANAGDRLEEALEKYKEAITVIPSTEVQKKIDDVQARLDEQVAAANKKEQYDNLIADAQSKFDADDLEGAKAKYEEAATVDPTQTLPAEKIAEIDQLLADRKAAQDKEEQYNQLIAEAESKFNADDLEGAKAKYQEAADVDPGQTLPAEKIAEIDQLIAERVANKAKEDQYNDLMTQADDLFNSNDLQGAKAKYEAAAQIDPSQSRPTERIREIDDLLLQQEADAERKANYDAAIADADHLFNEAQWEEAEAKYREAMTFDSSQSYASDRIAEIQQKIADRDAAAAKQEQIASLIIDGNGFIDQGELEKAKDKFEEVLTIDPSNVEATTQIQTINEQLAAQKSAAEKEEEFARLKEEGFQLADQKQYTDAKLKLNEALSLKLDQEIQDKLIEIDAALDQERIAAENEQKYNDLLTEASNKVSLNDLEGAIQSYEAASALKPDEQLPKDKIAELRNQIASQNANQQEIEEKYADAMTRGDQLMADEKYLDAIKAFNEALTYKPAEKEPAEKAAEAERLEREKGEANVQYEKILSVAQKKIDGEEFAKAEELLGRALKLKPSDPRPQEMLDQIKELKATNATYEGFMSGAESKASAQDYEGARELFQKAKDTKPSETLPDERIAEMDRLISERDSVDQTDVLYADYMRKGELTEGAKRYEEALGHYQNALSVKPADQAAQDKVDEIQQILDDLANANAERDRIQREFDALIKEADQLFSDEKYVPGARDKYEEALALIPSSSYALSQRDECVRRARNVARSDADKEYRKLIKVADKKFDKEDYDKAKELYERAVGFRSSDPYPKERLKEIDAIMNPVIVEAVELEDLGDPFDGSIIDGGFVLKEAEEQRQLQPSLQLDQEFQKIKEKNEEMTAMRSEDRLEIINDIYQLQQTIIAEGKDNEAQRMENLAILRDVEKKERQAYAVEVNLDYSSVITQQEQLDQYERDLVSGYEGNEEKRQENTELVKAIQVAEENQTRSLASEYVDRSLTTDGQLTEVDRKVEEDALSDFEMRLETEAYMGDAIAKARTVTEEKTVHDVLTSRAELEKVEGAREAIITKSKEDAQAARDNNDALMMISDDVQEEEWRQAMEQERNAYKTDAQIADVRRRVVSDHKDFTELSAASNEELKQIQIDYSQAQYEAYNGETDKYLKNQEVLDAETQKSLAIKAIEEEAHEDKVAYVKAMDKKAFAQQSQGTMSDEEERLQARKFVEGTALSKEEKAKVEREQHDESTEKFKDISTTVSAQLHADAEDQQKKVYSAQQALDNVDNKPKPKKKVANALGKEYPEGVSQESFTRKDQNGLVNTFITRRVVVIEGHADVYVRTQTTSGTTYSKNGNPSLEHIWNKETQDPSLERHY